MRESIIEKKVTDYAKTKGWLSYKWTSPGNRSVPDRLFFKSGQTVIVEFKAKGKDLTLLQKKTFLKLAKENLMIYFVDSLEKGYGIFHELDEVVR